MKQLNLKKLLSEKNIFLELKSTSKTDIISEMINRLSESGLIKDTESALKVILEREKKMSTGMECGVAIPHGKTDTVDRLIPAIGIKREGVDFDSLDKLPSQIFIMTISPESSSGPHIQFLAEISGLLKDHEKREQLLKAQTPREVVSVFQT